jgi:NADH-quinone oxidoreductase subunit K
MDNPELALLNNYLVVGAILFGLGAIGFVTRRNMIVMFLSAEMMLQGVSVSLVAWSRFYNDFGGQSLVVFIIAVAGCEAAIALALVMVLFQRRGTLDIMVWQELRETNQPDYAESEPPPEADEPPPSWPTLPLAGVRPQFPQDETEYRPHV